MVADGEQHSHGGRDLREGEEVGAAWGLRRVSHWKTRMRQLWEASAPGLERARGWKRPGCWKTQGLQALLMIMDYSPKTSGIIKKCL